VTKPLLAHYTSLSVLENIVKNNEIWFSNPLFMNDLEELKFGINTGMAIARDNAEIRELLGTAARHELFVSLLDGYFQQYQSDHVFDTYVFCASEHRRDDRDGLLSMWRGYGGAGKGVALIIDTSTLNLAPLPSPLILSKVYYGTVQERRNHLEGYCRQAAALLKPHAIADDRIYVLSNILFDRIKLFALFTKHKGFEEEKEWRAVYRRDLDFDKKFDQFFGYHIGSQGAEPRMKFKIEPVAGLTSDDLSLERIVHSILLGPSASSLLAGMSVKRMLTLLNRPLLAERVVGSSIPLRP